MFLMYGDTEETRPPLKSTAVVFCVETTRGRGKVLGFINGGRQHMKGRYYVLIKDLNGFNNFQWSEKLDITFKNLIKAVGEDPHFDFEVDIITSYLISFLEGSNIDVT